MVHNRMPGVVAIIVAVLAFAGACGAAQPLTTAPSSQPAAATDWPQWRGPNRDGIAPAGPKLLDSWPKEGPPLLWKSDTIPSTFGEGGKLGDAGGSGSVVVADGRAFVFVHWKRQVGKLLITTQMLKDYGWEEGVPDDLAKKIEEARLSEKRKNLKPGPDLDAYIKEFTAGVDPELAKKFGDHIKLRLTQGAEALSWDKDFAHLAKARDKEFKTYDELFAAIEHVFRPGTHGNPGSDNIIRLFADPFMAKVFSFTDTVVCLDTATGKELWRKEFPGALPEKELNWGASATPAIVGDRIYVAGSAALYCLAVKDGALVWQTKAVLGNSSPLVADGRIYIYEGDQFKTRDGDRYAWLGVGMLTAYSTDDGKFLWRQPKVTYTNGSVVLWAHEGRNYLISGARGGPYCIDSQTGAVLWEPAPGAPRVPGSWTNHGTPVISGDVAVLYTDPQMALRLTPQKPELMWKRGNGSRGASPLIYQDHAYFFGGQGHATCVDLKTGQVKWDNLRVSGESSSPILADGKIFYYPVEGANIGMFRASPGKFEELGRFPAAISACSSPAIADGRLYVRLKDGIACYDLRELGPYLGGVAARKDELVFDFKGTQGGLAVKDSPDGTVTGVTIRDAKGNEKPAKVRVEGSGIVVNIKDEIPPMEIRSAWSDKVTSKAGLPVPELRWKSLALAWRQCSGDTLTLSFSKPVDRELWKTDKPYAVAGMKVTNVELSRDALTARLTMDKPLKIGDTVSIKYPWLAAEGAASPLAEFAFTVLPGRPVTEGLLQEFLFGETRPKIDEKTILNEDVIDRNTKPAAGEKWRMVESIWSTAAGELGAFNLNECLGGGYNNLTHACVYVYSDADRKVQLWAASCNGIKIIVNGATAHTNLKPSAVDPWTADADKVKDVPLAKGWNTILIPIAQGGGWWSVSLRIRDENGNVATGLSYTAEKPAEGN